MPTIDIKGKPLFYFEYRVSTSEVPPLLLIHGAGGQHVHWPPAIRRLGGVQTFAPDLPGHGKSGGVGYDTIAAYAQFLLTLMESLEVPRFIAMGHSMGGAIAQQLALDAPERVAGLVLLATGMTMPVSDRILDNVLDDPAGVVDFVIKYAYSLEAEEDLRQQGRQAMKSIDPAVLRGDYLACRAFDVRGMLGDLPCPALIIGGEMDKMVPPAFQQELAEVLPDAEYVLLEGSGHMIPIEYPEAVAYIASDWLDRKFRT
jgi:pimeloyl-ACP methyl ester carboxylesterase